jgi:hypothetical protein
MDENIKDWYKISITRNNCNPAWKNYLNYYNNMELDGKEHQRLLTQEIIEIHNGRFLLSDGGLEPIGEYENLVNFVVFENHEDALAFILKWS